MMKKLLLFVVALTMTATASAQFEKGKAYIGASLSGLDLSYNGSQKGSIGLQGKVGCMVADNWLVDGFLSYDKQNSLPYAIALGVGGRYYIEQNGLYLGLSAAYKHTKGYNDLIPSLQVGYAFFLSRTVTIEPEIYYEQSFKSHSDYSTIGLRIGLGVYLFKDKTKN